MTEPYLAPSLKDQGYTGATGTTPYKPASQQQLGELQAAYNSTPVVPVVVPPASNVLSINFDGTHNNGNYPAIEKGESPTSIYQLSELQRGSIGDKQELDPGPFNKRPGDHDLHHPPDSEGVACRRGDRAG
jgi:hypothetical protein